MKNSQKILFIKIAVWGLQFFFVHNWLHAQTPLGLEFDHFCLYQGEKWPSELYKFPNVPAIDALKDDLLKGQDHRDFEFICSNVPSIAVALKGETYYILSMVLAKLTL
jgi:hypothetical protein